MTDLCIKIKLYSIFSQFSNKKETNVLVKPGAKVREAITILQAEIGDVVTNYILTANGELRGGCVILLNQRNVDNFQGLETPLNNKDILEIIPLLSGG